MKTDDDFEAAFSEFIDSEKYEKLDEALFELVRTIFRACWDAAVHAARQNA